MKNLLLIFLLFVLILPAVGQEDSIHQKTSFNNQIDLDVHFLGVQAIFKHNISNYFFTGIGVSTGVIASFSNESLLIDGFRFNLFLGYKQNKVDYYFGLRYAPGSFSKEYDNIFNMYGFEVGIFYKVSKSKLEIGTNISYIKAQETGGGTSFVAVAIPFLLIILKIPLAKW